MEERETFLAILSSIQVHLENIFRPSDLNQSTAINMYTQMCEKLRSTFLAFNSWSMKCPWSLCLNRLNSKNARIFFINFRHFNYHLQYSLTFSTVVSTLVMEKKLHQHIDIYIYIKKHYAKNSERIFVLFFFFFQYEMPDLVEELRNKNGKGKSP